MFFYMHTYILSLNHILDCYFYISFISIDALMFLALFLSGLLRGKRHSGLVLTSNGRFLCVNASISPFFLLQIR